METTIKINNVENRLDLYRRYDGQLDAQNCYIWLNCEEMGAASDGEIGNAVSMDVYHGLTRRYHLPYPVYAESANQLMQDILPLAERVIAGFERVWDGSNNVGRLGEDAQAAEEEIEKTIEQSLNADADAIKVWDASDWFEKSDPLEIAAELGITADMSEDDVEKLTDKAEEKYLDPGTCDIIECMAGYLKYTVLEAVRVADEENR